MRITVLGGTGFIGRAILKRLAAEDHDVYAPDRGGIDWARDLGHVIYAIGLTADFRTRPFETVDAHVNVLADVLRRGRYESFLYLSSARVYQGATDTREEAPLSVRPSHPGDLYNLSKLMGESLCLAVAQPSTRVARLANVYGFDPDSENFLSTVLRDAASRGTVHFQTALESSKDYVAIEDVVTVVLRIAASARHRLYNVASGRNVTHREIADFLQRTGVGVSVGTAAPVTAAPVLRIDRVIEEFGFEPQELVPRLPALYRDFVARFGRQDEGISA
jgi:nucleoside-diphosphate-sugar epimerase